MLEDGRESLSSLVMYEAVQRSWQDVNCDLSYRKEATWQLAIIREKRLLVARSANIKGAFLISDDEWKGYATCFERAEYSILQIDADAGEKNLMIALKFVGDCKVLE